MTLHLRATGRHLPYGITQCYLPPDTSERAPPNPIHAGWYSIYLPRRDGRLSDSHTMFSDGHSNVGHKKCIVEESRLLSWTGVSDDVTGKLL